MSMPARDIVNFEARRRASGKLDELITKQQQQCDELTRLIEKEMEKVKELEEVHTRRKETLLDGESTLDAALLKVEKELVARALEESDGKVSQAAELLGLSHQGLVYKLENRLQDIKTLRTKPKNRGKK